MRVDGGGGVMKGIYKRTGRYYEYPYVILINTFCFHFRSNMYRMRAI